MFMKRKIKSAKGFTLAELLIVVAIIAVLVAIGIPIFTSQLEKSREAVDLSDVRSAYAEVMMAAITGDTTAIYTKDANQTIYNQAKNVYSITVKLLKQKQDGWQTALPITIGGVSSTDNVHWVGTPGANGECVITYIPPAGAADEAVKFTWSGGTGEENSGAGGNGGGISGGNSGPGEDNGNTGENGGTGESTNPPEPGNNTGGTSGDDSKSEIVNTYSPREWPQKPAQDDTRTHVVTYQKGQVVYYNGYYYVCGADSFRGEYNRYYYTTPDNLSWNFCKLDVSRKHYPNQISYDTNKYSQPTVTDLHQGDVFIAENGDIYVYPGGGDFQTAPTIDSSHWILIRSEWFSLELVGL